MVFYVAHNARDRVVKEFETRSEARRYFNDLVKEGVKCIHMYYGSLLDGYVTLDLANY